MGLSERRGVLMRTGPRVVERSGRGSEATKEISAGGEREREEREREKGREREREKKEAQTERKRV